jgi:hypothetical protein
LFGAISGVLYTMFAFTSVTYVTLLVAMVLLTTAFLFASSAQNGMTAAIGQQHLMTGQVSAMWNIFEFSVMVTACPRTKRTSRNAAPSRLVGRR